MYSGLLIGMLFGILLQRGQFCFVSGFRQIYQQKSLRFLTALFIAISIQSIGFFALAELGLITIPTSQLPVLATLLGGLIFGFGMVLANCCGSGAWFRSGEGALGSFIALITFSITMASTQTGSLKNIINGLTANPTEIDNIYLTFGISPWVFVAFLVLITLVLIKKTIRSDNASSLTPFITGTFIGLLGIVAWYFSAQAGRNYGFGIAVPSANVVQYLVTGQQRYLNWGSLFVLGIIVGSFLSAKLAGNFTLRVPEPQDFLRRIVGGVLMGIGAALAGGCTVTNALVATAYFSWQGWLATLMIFIGSWIANLVFKRS
ncbi:YeeE/YedE family protein [Actinobacillus porcinus]|uniref:YeeE/YedE family protein n=1 Tax=Actinobacillus porcinus TaxID=51048 RepID=UPI002A915A73|nr:YeeE/YedE family protein [Actinobacillus porcinus]MDY6216057.1 YeeE/YedE family protein [Actinobacillus porcinus]